MVGVFRAEVRQAREALASPARPWERTGSIDVEHLVAWAYGVQMVDRFERVGLLPIEAAAAGYELSGYSACGVGQLMAIEHLGARIDKSRVSISDVCHAAAYAVAQAVQSVDNGARVRYHGLSGTRPKDWVEPERKARAAVWVTPGEKAQVEYQGPGRKGAYCRVIMLWDRERETWGRQQYRLWWQALSDVAWALQARALGFIVTGPAVPAEPWAAAGERAEASSIALDPRPDGGGRTGRVGGGAPGLGSSRRSRG